MKVNSLQREEREKKHEQRLVGTLNMDDPPRGPSGGPLCRLDLSWRLWEPPEV